MPWHDGYYIRFNINRRLALLGGLAFLIGEWVVRRSIVVIPVQPSTTGDATR